MCCDRCVFEQAVSSAAEAHLAQVDNDAECGNLPAHIVQAQAARPKLTILEGEQDTKVIILQEPAALLERALAELQTATFRGGDAEVVKAQFLHLEWIMSTAMVRSADVVRYGAALTLEPARRRSIFAQVAANVRRHTSTRATSTTPPGELEIGASAPPAVGEGSELPISGGRLLCSNARKQPCDHGSRSSAREEVLCPWKEGPGRERPVQRPVGAHQQQSSGVSQCGEITLASLEA